MRVRAIDHGLQDVLGVSDGPRSKGLHASDLYGKLYQQLEPGRFDTGAPMNYTKMAMGLAWELYLESLLVRQGVQADRPGEFKTAEGIAFSPDLLVANGHSRVGEIKLTYMSNRDDITAPKFAKWLTQVMFYCRNLGIPFARFYVLYVNGNYKEQRDPILQAYDVEFSNRELEDNHQMLINVGKQEGLL